jgi:hypothetical protein
MSNYSVTQHGRDWPEQSWTGLSGAACPGVSGPRDASTPGTAVPAAGPSAGLVRAVPRVRGKAAVVTAPATRDVVLALGGRTNTHNYMTGAIAVFGEGASGPPPHREPA